MSKKKQRANHDSAWKDILEVYFKEFMEFFYPEIAQKIDWRTPYESLDNELQSITTDAMIGKTFVDKLIKIKSLAGREEVVLIHVEVQGQKEEKFSKRLFQYYCKLFTKYDQSILTLAILTDSNRSWHPANYQKKVFGFSVLTFNFKTHKLLDYQDKKPELEISSNPFAMVVLVHLIFLETKKDLKARFLMKLRLTRLLYERGCGRDYVINLLKVIDWALVISPDLELEYKETLHKLEEEQNMAYVTSFERLGIEKGLQQGRQQGLQEGLQEGRQEGRQEGERHKALVIAKNLLKQNISWSVIQSATGLSEQELALEEDVEEKI
jgi:hypothetical protein